MRKKIIIAGAGGIGRACGLILLRNSGRDIRIELTDINPDQCKEAATWIRSGLTSNTKIMTTQLPVDGTDTWNPDGDILLDCTPGEYAPEFARTALRCGMHYANLTENLPSTREIYQIAEKAPTGFALQTGLAPGFINQLARLTARQFNTIYPDYELHSIRMRVGSLSQYAASPGYYAFVWNPMGVSTEYLNDSEIIKSYIKETVPSLSERETIIINGVRYEADFTSGGAADLPAHYDRKIKELNYKTLRYPGHFDYIYKLKNDLDTDLSRQSLLQRMIRDIPFQNKDRVLIYCSVSGRNLNGITQELIHHKEILPARYGSIQLTAIQRATASALAQTAILLLSNQYQGVLTQSQYPLDEFLNGEIIREHYGTFYENSEHDIT